MPVRGAKLPGDHIKSPIVSSRFPPGQSYPAQDEIFNSCPSTRLDLFEDFVGAFETYTLEVPLVTAAGAQNQATTGTAIGVLRVPRGGVITGVSVVGGAALATSDTNYLTFTLTNKLGSGSGAVAMLAATAPNTTQATGGTAITAYSSFDCTLSGTALSLNVCDGDTLVFTSTATGTLANAVTYPMVRVTIKTVKSPFVPRIARTASVPLVGVLASTANGVLECQLNATAEVQTAGIDFGDNLMAALTSGFFYSVRAKISAVAASTQYWIGLGDSYNATVTSMNKYVGFRVVGNDASLVTTITGTNSTDTGLDLTTDTYYTFTVDGTNLNKIKFYLNEAVVGTASYASFSTTKFQPQLDVRRTAASGVTQCKLTIDSVRLSVERV